MNAAKVARVGRRDYTRAELPPSTWRQSVKRLASWMALGFLGWLIWGPLVYFALVVK